MLALLFLIAHARDGLLRGVLAPRVSAPDRRRACVSSSPLSASTLRQARLRRFDLAAMALQLSGQFGDAAMRDIQLALRIVACALGIDLARSSIPRFRGRALRRAPAAVSICALSAWISRSRASMPACAPPRRSTRAKPAPNHSPVTRDHRFMRGQSRGQLRAPRRATPPYAPATSMPSAAAGPRTCAASVPARASSPSADAISARSVSRSSARSARMGERRFDQHAFEQAGQARFRPHFPSRRRHRALHRGAAICPARAAPAIRWPRIFPDPSAACCRASSEARRPRKRCNSVRASLSCVARCAFGFDNLLMRAAALVEQRRKRFDFFAMRVVFAAQLLGAARSARLKSAARFSARSASSRASGFQRLPIEVIQPRALDFRRLRRFRARFGVRVPLVLPFGQLRLGVAHLLRGLRRRRRSALRVSVRRRRARASAFRSDRGRARICSSSSACAFSVSQARAFEALAAVRGCAGSAARRARFRRRRDRPRPARY